MQKYSLSLVVPAFNEEELISDFIHKSVSDLKKVSDDFEIILVNDKSTDRTLEIAEKLKVEFDCLRIISLKKNSGVGIATKIGLKAATKQIVFNNTVDAFFNTEELPKFLNEMEDNDVVSGYRTNLKSNNIYGKILTVGNFYLIKILFNLNFKAVQTVQFFKKNVLDNITIELNSTFIAPELLIKAKKMGYRIKELGTIYQKRRAGKGKCGRISNVIDSFCEIIYYWYKWNVLKFIKNITSAIKEFAGRHYLAILFFLIVGLISVSQQFLAINALGHDYKGLYYVHYIDNVDAYIAKMGDILDGHWLAGSPYFYEYKNNTQFVLPIGEYIYLAPAFIFGLSFAETLVFNQFFFPALLFLLVYFLFYKILAEDSFNAKMSSICAGVLVVLGFDLANFKEVPRLLLGSESSVSGLIWNRPVNPATGAILLFALLIILWHIFNSQKKSKIPPIIAGVILGLTIGYIFTWFLAISFVGVLFIISIIKRSYLVARKLFLTIVVSFLIALPYWINIFHSMFNNNGDDRLSRNGAFFTHAPVINKFLTLAFAVFLAIMIFEYFRKKLLPWHWFCFSLLVGSEIAFNQQVITGVDIWHQHFVQYTVPLVFIVFVFALYYYIKLLSTRIWKLLMVLIIIGCVILGIKISEQYKFKLPEYRHFQTYSGVFDWFNKFSERESVVLVNENGEELVRFLPGFTHVNTYTVPGGYDLEVPPDRRYHNFLVLLRIWGVSPNEVNSYLTKNFMLVSEYFFKDWNQALSREYQDWMTEKIKNISKDYAVFVNENFETMLKKYRIDYILSVGEMKKTVKVSLPDAKLIKVFDNQYYLYKF